jgi:hypothetical protein
MRRWTLTAALLAAGAMPCAAQRVVLELRPRAGDTLRLRLDQTTEMSGTRGSTSTRPISTTLRMYSRAIVESTTAASATILALTDSVVVSSTDDRARALADATERQLSGKQLRIRMAPDGTLNIVEPQGVVSREVTDAVSIMPASFPKAAVAVGDTWMREMPIPPSASMGVPLGGMVRAAFRLDSLGANGDVAYLSMRGTMHPLTQAIAVSDPRGILGSVTGSMVVDRRRGWLSESRFLIESRANVAPPGGAPMQFRLRITQHMKVLERRD